MNCEDSEGDKRRAAARAQAWDPLLRAARGGRASLPPLLGPKGAGDARAFPSLRAAKRAGEASLTPGEVGSFSTGASRVLQHAQGQAPGGLEEEAAGRGLRQVVGRERGTVAEAEGSTPAEDSGPLPLLGRLPAPLLDTLTAVSAPASPQRVASSIRGFFASKFGAVAPDTGCLTRPPVHVARHSSWIV
ncbi:uncharacterized protein LOC134528231 [Bacillus rossius redtenbacheri]|uniref:uncharacterized protein LOC134528231 n=1 Tax=Bacillus rossius redtenbacheri TaxID=93214 RepID=UPI002FDD24F6